MEKAHSVFKMIFNATLSQKMLEYDIFQKTLFSTLALSTNLALYAVAVAAGRYL